jgi:hypothetical protein
MALAMADTIERISMTEETKDAVAFVALAIAMALVLATATAMAISLAATLW